jgi:large subunit ribosomal protein L9
MQVVLVENIEKLGKLGDVVQVKPGYARNYLLPRGAARMATQANVREIEARRAEFERAEKEKFDQAASRQKALDGHAVTIKAKAGSEGKLFGSVSAGDIADALSAEGLAVEKREVRLPEGPLRTVGTFEIGLHLFSDIDATVSVTVAAD